MAFGSDSIRGLFSSAGSGGDEQELELDVDIERTLTDLTASEEAVHHYLPGTGLQRGEGGNESEADSGSEFKGAITAATDRRVLFSLYSETGVERTEEVAYTDVQSVEFVNDPQGSRVVLEPWEDESYRFRPIGDEETIDEAVSYIETASESWGVVETLLEELDGQVIAVENYPGDEAFDRVETMLDGAYDTLESLTERVQSEGLEAALGSRVESARHDLERAHVEARLSRASALLDEAESHLDAQGYGTAFDCASLARTHLESAGDIAAEYDFAVKEEVKTEWSRLETFRKRLSHQPVKRADETAYRALQAMGPDRMEAFEAAMERYHDAIALDWGGSLDPSRDRMTLRLSVELMAVGVIDAAEDWALEMMADGDTLAMAGHAEGAVNRYQEAVDILVEAQESVSEFRMVDPSRLDETIAELEEKIRKTEGFI